MSGTPRDHLLGVAAVLFASIVWGTTGTAATFAPDVGSAAIGSAAMGLGGLLQALRAGGSIARSLRLLMRYRALLLLGGASVAVYPLAFYGSMRLAGVAIGTVVTIGSAPLFSALIELAFDRTPLTRRWMAGALVGVAGIALLASAKGMPGGPVGGEGVVAGILCGIVGCLT